MRLTWFGATFSLEVDLKQPQAGANAWLCLCEMSNDFFHGHSNTLNFSTSPKLHQTA